MSSSKDAREADRLFDELQARSAACGQLPGWRIRADVYALDRSLRIFLGNARELERHFEAHASETETLRLSDRSRPENLDAFLNQVDRLLHNYLAAAMSLRDHSRQIASRRLPPCDEDNYAETYRDGIDAVFAKLPAAQFIQGLRNYTMHRRIPVTQGQFRLTREKRFTSTVILPTSQLLAWDGWNPLARKLIADAGDAVALSDVLFVYTGAIRQFHRWLRQALLHRHRVAIHELQQEEESIAKAFSELTGEPIRRRTQADPTR
jgi:hypothetical protein